MIIFLHCIHPYVSKCIHILFFAVCIGSRAKVIDRTMNKMESNLKSSSFSRHTWTQFLKELSMYVIPNTLLNYSNRRTCKEPQPCFTVACRHSYLLYQPFGKQPVSCYSQIFKILTHQSRALAAIFFYHSYYIFFCHS